MHLTTDQTVPGAESGAEAAPPKVLYVAGMTRSGTTILDKVLNELDGFIGAGEVRSYWRAMREPRMCGCGKIVSECEFWSDVRAWIEARHGPLPVERAWSLQREHIRSLPVHLARLARADGGSSPGAEYAELMTHLYQGIAAVGEAEVVVDSSKGPHDAYVLSRFTDLDLFVVHLVRDPRGVAYSWARGAWNPDKPMDRDEHREASEVGVRWLTRNALTEVLLARRLGPRYMRVRYEDFVADPDRTITQISAMCGVGRRLAGLSEGVVKFGTNHSVSGNPSRLSTGPVKIRTDDEWTQKMEARPMLAATIGAAPLLRRYGYDLRPDALDEGGRSTRAHRVAEVAKQRHGRRRGERLVAGAHPGPPRRVGADLDRGLARSESKRVAGDGVAGRELDPMAVQKTEVGIGQPARIGRSIGPPRPGRPPRPRSAPACSARPAGGAGAPRRGPAARPSGSRWRTRLSGT